MTDSTEPRVAELVEFAGQHGHRASLRDRALRRAERLLAADRDRTIDTVPGKRPLGSRG